MRAVALLAGFVFEVASAALVVGLPGAWLLRHMDLARLAATQASTALGRPVSIESLKLKPGATLAIEVSGVVVPNIEGGSAPYMVRLRRLTAEIDARSLLHGPVQLRRAAAEGLDVLLERTADRTPNWRFGPPGKPEAPPDDPTGRTGFPSIRDIVVSDSALTYRTGSGKNLLIRLDSGSVATQADDLPVHLSLTGSYNGTGLTLEGDLQSLAALRDRSKPYGTVLRIASGDVRLVFDGTMTDPLNVDGATGTLDLQAPDPAPILAIAGVDDKPDISLFLSGAFEHKDPVWRLDHAIGSLQTSEVLAATLVFQEGPHGQPDRVEADVSFDTLDLNDMLGTAPAKGTKNKRSDADMSLAVARSPDTLVKARVTAKNLAYAALDASRVTLAGSVTDGRVAVDELSLTAFGTALRAEGRVEAEGQGGRITADVQATGADIQALRRTLGFGAIPLTGRLDAQATVDATARTLNAAVRAARASVVVAMRGGAVEKAIVEMASTDVRALFRTNKGLTPVVCLLAGIDMRGGAGTLAPLRLRAAEGTIAGSAQFDLYRRTFDLTIGSEARSTGFFALDIPVRAWGSFASPEVRPAQWSAQGRALLAAADNLTRLPPALQAFARRYPCPRLQ